MSIRYLVSSALGVILAGLGATPADAQAGPPCGPDLPIKCTPGKDAAIVIGFVGAGALAVYIAYRMDHPRNEVTIGGCAALDNGAMTLTDESTHTLYPLMPGHKKLRAGNRVLLRGKVSHDSNGQNIFRVRKILKDDGPCEAQERRDSPDPG